MTVREYDVVVQMGHVARITGGTGTTGHRGSEQDFVRMLGPKIRRRLTDGGLSCALIGADDKRPSASVFLALHQDGATSPTARGASVGYPVHGDGGTLAKIWKARYTLAGWPDGFRPDNYTIGLRWYYGFAGLRRPWWKRARFDSAFLIEHGFATTVSEETWMWDHVDEIAAADADTILQYFGKFNVLNTNGKSDMDIINDTEKKRMWAVWVLKGTTIVREYAKYRGEKIGTPLPGIGYVIDEQITAGKLVKA